MNEGKMNCTHFSIIRMFLTLWFATVLSAPAFAALGKTVDECRKVYGRPPYGNKTYEIPRPGRIEYFYSWRDLYISAVFVGRDVKDSRCGHVTYRKYPKPNVPMLEMTKAEIETILALNANGNTWEPVPGGWKRSDNRALAVQSTYTHDAVPDHVIVIFTADFYPRDSKAFAEVRARLSGHSSK
jgi:hypothetical protein